MNATALKIALLAFWCVWLCVVFAGNLCDGLKELGLLGDGWKFASGNFEFLATTTARYRTDVAQCPALCRGHRLGRAGGFAVRAGLAGCAVAGA